MEEKSRQCTMDSWCHGSRRHMEKKVLRAGFVGSSGPFTQIVSSDARESALLSSRGEFELSIGRGTFLFKASWGRLAGI